MVPKPHLGRILLIDDNQFGQLARRAILVDAGFDVVTAPSGAEGLQLLAACATGTPFDLVVTDYRMPGMRGDEVIRHIRETKPEMPVVMLSGHVRSLGLTAESTGADVVLEKGPREQDELKATVAGLTCGRLQRKPAATETGSSSGRQRALRGKVDFR